MSGTTSSRRYPYPGPSDADNVPADIQALADAVDADMTTIKSTIDNVSASVANLAHGQKIASGVYSLNLSSAPIQQGTINFGAAFSAPPQIVIGTQSTGGVSPLKIGFNIDISNATTTGIRIGLWNSTGAAFGPYSIAWLAVGPA